MYINRVIGIICLALCAEVAQAKVGTIFISGQQVKSNLNASSSELDPTQGLAGIEFQVTQPAVVTQVGGVFQALSVPSSLYGAVVPMNSNGLPDVSGLTASNIALLQLPNSTAAASAVLAPAASTLLQPGTNYAVVFGTNQFGASGNPAILADPNFVNPLVPQLPFVVLNSTGQRVGQAAPVALGAFGSLLSAPGAGVSLLTSDKVAADPTISFETGSTALPTIAGVHFLSSGNFEGIAEGTTALFGDQAFENASSIQYTDLGIGFDTPVNRVGFWISDAYLGASNLALANTITLKALDSQGNVLYSSDINIPSAKNNQGKMFVGLDSQTPISTLEWLSNNQGFFGVDNVSYAAVPEPASFGVLIAVAAIGIGYRRRRPSTSTAQ